MVRTRIPTVVQAGRGFVYLTVLFAVAVVSLGVSSYAVVWSHEAQRARETELLFIGEQFRAAIGSYHEQSPGAVKRYPERLQDLIFDSRYLTTKRHLRRVYVDPITTTEQWGIVPAPDGGIMGVYSISEKSPVKVGGFEQPHADFAKARHYSEWRFVYVPSTAPVSGNENTGVFRPR